MALQAEVIQRPNLALCLLIDQLLVEIGDSMTRAFHADAFDLSATSAHHDLLRVEPDLENSAAWKAVRKALEVLTHDTPKDRGEVLPWLLARPQADNIELLAALVGITVYRVASIAAPSRHAPLRVLSRACSPNPVPHVWWGRSRSLFVHYGRLRRATSPRVF